MSAKDRKRRGKLREVLRCTSRGAGLSRSFVAAFGGSKDPQERDAVKSIVLGTDLESAVAPLASKWRMSGDLLRFMVAQGKIDSIEASRGADRLTPLFERWASLREKRAMEQKVMDFRGIVIAVVMGLVVGMLSSFAPLISNFQLSLTATQTLVSDFNPYEGIILIFPCTLALGYYLSPERPYKHVVIACLAFVAVVYFLSPLATLSIGP